MRGPPPARPYLVALCDVAQAGRTLLLEVVRGRQAEVALQLVDCRLPLRREHQLPPIVVRPPRILGRLLRAQPQQRQVVGAGGLVDGAVVQRQAGRIRHHLLAGLAGPVGQLVGGVPPVVVVAPVDLLRHEAAVRGDAVGQP